MARPSKQGLDYFPFDIDFFDNEIIGAISGEYGIKGEITTIKLLCAVYKNGYFVVWNDLLKMQLLKKLPGISSELLDQILNRLVKWGFFDQALFSSDKILTSIDIQKRFFEITKRRKTDDQLGYLLVNVCNNRVNVYNNGVNVCNNEQSKVKERNNTHSYAREESLFPSDEVFEKPLAECYQELESNQSWMETVCMNTRLNYKDFTPEGFYVYLKQFFMRLQNEGIVRKSPADAMSHFAKWLSIVLKKQRDDERSNKNRWSGTQTNPTNQGYQGTEQGINTEADGLTNWINGLSIGR